MAVAAPFVWRCLSGCTIAPFPHPAHRTGQADFPHPALGQDFTLSRATPSAASGHLLELIGFPISRSFTTYCVCLELRSLPSTGVTRLQRSYDPVRLPPWPPPFATLRPLPSPLTGLPRLPEPPFQRAVPTTPADRAGARVDCFPAHAAFPKWQEGRHPHCHFRGLLRLHSRYGPPDCSTA